MKTYNALVIGCGIAGCVTAIRLAESMDNVALITKEENPLNANTFYAQGGIIYKGETDAWDILKQDIMFAGGGISKEDAVGVLCDYGAADVREFLIKKIQVPFARDEEGKLDLTDEGAHSQRRIIHCADNTGEVILRFLHDYIYKNTNIEFIANHNVIDLITSDTIEDPLKKYGEQHCIGAYIQNNETGEIDALFSENVILATGGCGNIYQNTTNPISATGDGYAIARRAGAQLINMEYTQFHPTTLYHASGDRFLISESVRGEGGTLRTREGDAFMKKYHKMGDLAPRDIVTRSILDIMITKKIPCVFLDCSSIGKEELKERFPNIYSTCLEKYHFDITKSWIPVTPAFHFMCGGIKTDTYGRTNLNGLYAVGETACTGLHGANRLASTSLLEGLVFGIRVAENIINRNREKTEPISFPVIALPKNNKEKGVDPVILQQFLQTLKSVMWNLAGPIRTYDRLKIALKTLVDMEENIEELYYEYRIEKSILELRNAVQTGVAIARAARNNKNSKGCHYILED